MRLSAGARPRHRAGAASAALLACAAAHAQTAPLAAIAPAIVRVVASDCSGAEPSRAGSGFAWPAAGQVVTDLHVIAGCSTIAVDYQGIDERPAHPIHILIPADLALLAVDGAPATPVPTIAATPPPPGTGVQVFGFALGQPTRDTHPLELTFGNAEAPHLADVLPDAERQDIARIGFPALTTEILRLDGNLLPGHSGAPILDPSGAVIGIGSGGLERGAVGVGWAIRARYLADLLHAPAQMPGGAGTATSAFATAAPQTSASGVRCGEATLYRRRTRQIAAIAASAGDTARLQQLAADLAGVPIDALPEHAPFAIWAEPHSGAALVLPAWLPLVAVAEGCEMHARQGGIRYVIRVGTLPQSPGPARREAVRAAFASSTEILDRLAGIRLHDAPQFELREHRAGMVVRHKLMTRPLRGQEAVSVYRADIAGEGAFLLAAVINDHATLQGQKPAPDTPWALGVYGIALSGFPPGKDGDDGLR